MREIRLKCHDLTAAGFWALAVLLLAADSMDGSAGLWSRWAQLVIAAAIVTTLIGWVSRRILHPDSGEAARLESIDRSLSVLKGQRGHGHPAGE